MVRSAYFDSNGTKKGKWSKEEDKKLRNCIQTHGQSNWRLVPIFAGLARCGKSCRLRWVNYLKPGLKRGNFAKHEKDLISELHAQLGNKWSAIAAYFPGRTDNEIKNFWHAHVQKRSKRKHRPVRKAVIKTQMPKEELSHAEINFRSVYQTESTPSNNVNILTGLSVGNLGNINHGNNFMTEEYQSSCDLSTPSFAEGEIIDNFWLCEEMQKNNTSVFFEPSDGGNSTAESQLGDFWAEALGDVAISWYFGDIMNMLQH